MKAQSDGQVRKHTCIKINIWNFIYLFLMGMVTGCESTKRSKGKVRKKKMQNSNV